MPDDLSTNTAPDHIAIACGGTGGHLFPGMAVGEELRRRGCTVTLFVSPKDVDQQAIQSITGMTIVTLPAVGFNPSRPLQFARGFLDSYRLAKSCFAQRPPQFVLGMGGFTAAAPILAARKCHAKTFLHESNSFPGRANRWLARFVDGAFVYFPSAAKKLAARRIEVVGMPVRPGFHQPIPPAAARTAMGLKPDAPTLLIVGGSQGARRVNELASNAAPLLRQAMPGLQFVHLTGKADFEKVRKSYQAANIPATVHPFWNDMPTALAAADVALSRSGASSLAEFAARQLPCVLIPFAAAADNHQFSNARAFVECGAARMLSQKTTTPAQLTEIVVDLLNNPAKRAAMQNALAEWSTTGAAADVAERILRWPAHLDRPVPGARINPQKLGMLNV